MTNAYTVTQKIVGQEPIITPGIQTALFKTGRGIAMRKHSSSPTDTSACIFFSEKSPPDMDETGLFTSAYWSIEHQALAKNKGIDNYVFIIIRQTTRCEWPNGKATLIRSVELGGGLHDYALLVRKHTVLSITYGHTVWQIEF